MGSPVAVVVAEVVARAPAVRALLAGPVPATSGNFRDLLEGVMLNCIQRNSGTKGWQLTNWTTKPESGWQQQPVIMVDGQVYFFGNHPQEYIDALELMHRDASFVQGPFHALIGQLQDELERVDWPVGEGIKGEVAQWLATH